MPREKYIRASDIGTHEFCPVFLDLKDAGAPTTLVHEQQQGIAFHETHGQRTRRATRAHKLSSLLILAALILLALAFLLSR